MKATYWTYWLILLGIFIIGVMMLVSSVTSGTTQDYYMLKEVTQSAMVDALDYSYYRLYGDIKINEDKFLENFIRRYAESTTISKKFNIEFYDIYELPPKVSVKISSSSNSVNVANTANNSFDLVNKLDVILVGGVSGGGTGSSNSGTSTTTESICCIHFNESFKTYIKTLSDDYLTSNGLDYLLQYKDGEMNFRQAMVSQFPGIVGSSYSDMNALRNYMLNNSVLSHAIENNQAYIITNTSSCS